MDMMGATGQLARGVSFSRPTMLSLLLVSALSSCTTTGAGGGTGGLFGRGASASTPYIANLQGGIVSRSGMALSRGDLTKALEAEYRALESAPGGQAVSWSGDAKGEVVASAPYQVGTQNCRQYAHTVNDGEREAKVRGAACRNPDGTWTPLS